MPEGITSSLCVRFWEACGWMEYPYKGFSDEELLERQFIKGNRIEYESDFILTIDAVRAEVLKEDRAFHIKFEDALELRANELGFIFKLTAADWAECYLKAKQLPRAAK